MSLLEVPEGDNVTVCVVIGEGSAQTLDRAVIFRSVGFATGTREYHYVYSKPQNACVYYVYVLYYRYSHPS